MNKDGKFLFLLTFLVLFLFVSSVHIHAVNVIQFSEQSHLKRLGVQTLSKVHATMLFKK